jgi:hypothetical protein
MDDIATDVLRHASRRVVLIAEAKKEIEFACELLDVFEKLRASPGFDPEGAEDVLNEIRDRAIEHSNRSKTLKAQAEAAE